MKIFLKNLRKCAPDERDNKIQQLILNLEISESSGTLEEMLNWEEIHKMAMNNISFGAHTVTHPILTQMPLAEAVDEIKISKETIEKHLRSPVKLFAYPNGSNDDFNESIKQALKEMSFSCAVTTVWGNNCIHTDPFELRRVGIWDFDPRISALRLGWHNFSL